MSIDIFFNPKSIAVIGASRTPGKVGYNILESLKGTFKERLYPINPLATEIANIPTFSSVENIPDEIDAAVIVVKADLVSKALDECIKKKIKAITIISTGFAESGQKELEEELKKILKGKNARVLGPSAFGVYQPKVVDMLFLSKERLKRPPEGLIGIITQSGSVGSFILDQMGFEGIGISKFIAYGNGMDLNETSLLDYFGRDMATRAIGLQLEYVSNVPEFIKTASKAAKIKPVVVLKSGKTKRGSEAILAHTGVTPGPAEAYSAAFRQAGILEAKDSEELLDFVKVLASQPPIRGNRIAIVTNSGSIGVSATDAAVQNGFEVPEFSKESLKGLRNAAPDLTNIRNPIDLTGAANSEWYQKAIESVAKDKTIDAVLVISLLQAPQIDENIVDVLRDAKIHGKPIVFCTTKSDYTIKYTRRLEGLGIPVYSTPERAVKALSVLREYGKTLPPPKVEKVEEKKPSKKSKHKKAKKKKR